MHVYRYRSPGLLSQKGLLYDEWYFASREELNDPIDMQSKFEFPENSEDIWFRVLSPLWKNDPSAKTVANYLSSICPVSYDELLGQFDLHMKNIIENVFNVIPLDLADFKCLNHLLSELKALLSLYSPSAGYSVSLSTSNDEMLMWSHYAASHSGYCLIYRPINGYLNQSPINCKSSLSVSKGHKSVIGDKFKVEKIEYNNKLESIDAFSLLPSYNTGYDFDSEEDRLNFHKKVQRQLLTKNECWSYENESRLLLPQPSKWISGQSTLSSYKRLFHYDFRQVVGVVFGALMNEHEKSSIKEILNEKLSERFKNCNESKKSYVFDFLYQQAEICSSSRGVKIIDQELMSMGTFLETGSEYYNRQLKSWKEFKGITLESGKFSYDEIP
jgi:hypothetical protein